MASPPYARRGQATSLTLRAPLSFRSRGSGRGGSVFRRLLLTGFLFSKFVLRLLPMGLVTALLPALTFPYPVRSGPNAFFAILIHPVSP